MHKAQLATLLIIFLLLTPAFSSQYGSIQVPKNSKVLKLVSNKANTATYSPKTLGATTNETKKYINSPVIDKNTDISGEKDLADWTFMVYLDADNNLEDMGVDDFLEMSKIGSKSQMHVVVLFDRNFEYSEDYGDWSDTRLFYVEKNLEPWPDNAIMELGELNMGDPEVLYWFVNWTVHNYPAKHYILVLWDHGGGFYGCCWDEYPINDNLDISEIMKTLEKLEQEGIHIDILGFDACIMATAEVALAIAPYADYMVASEETEPGDGWPYNDILYYLSTHLDSSPETIANQIACLYVKSYSRGSQGEDDTVTQSAIRLKKMLSVAYNLSLLSKILLKKYTNYSEEIYNAALNAEYFMGDSIDLYNFTLNIYSLISDGEIQTLALQLLDAIDLAIVGSYAGSYHSNAYGLSVHFPWNIYDNMYDNILFSKRTMWNELIKWVYGTPFPAWISEVWIENATDFDSDGYYEYVRLNVDADTYKDKASIRIAVYGVLDNGTSYYICKTPLFKIAKVDNDPYSIDIWNLTRGNHSYFRIQIIYSGRTAYSLDYTYGVSDDTQVLGDHENTPPSLQILSPSNNSYIQGNLSISWQASDDLSGLRKIVIIVNSSYKLSVSPDINNVKIQLADDYYTIYVIAYDNAGNYKNTSLIVVLDNTKPVIKVASPKPSSILITDKVQVVLQVEDMSGIKRSTVYLDGHLILDENTSISSFTLSLSTGSHNITIVMVDLAGNVAVYQLNITTITPLHLSITIIAIIAVAIIIRRKIITK